MDLLIRPAVLEDHAALLAVWDSATAQAYDFLPRDFLARERANIIPKYLPASDTYLAELDGGIAGFIALQGIEVSGLFVAAVAQRRGVGRALLRHAMDLRGMLELEVYSANSPALAFYRACGFEALYERLHEDSGQAVTRLWLPIADPPGPAGTHPADPDS